MKTKNPEHTPGPWHAARSSGSQGLIISEANGANVAVSYDPDDAPLIAAAPELLAALQFARDALTELNQQENDGGELLRNIDAAIAKAEGF